ncbi:MAG: alpha-ketoacid dehydrogenase subunit beta [Deltaproteobacteria bacterium]|nr:alpha-ketoacid dehydrogenase subunit beta [Deltaproteobacteria bacterium]
MREITYAEAFAEALREILRADKRVCVVGSYFFGLSPRRALIARLRKEFPSRFFDPPIAEAGYCGLAVGAAMASLRPIVDVATASFFLQAFPQVLNEAANTYYMTGGQTKVPVVFHMLHGIRGGGAAQHSHSLQAMLWNTPGLEIMLPSTPRDVKGLLKTAVRSENPTIFVDHAKLFEVKGEVPEEDYEIPFGQAEVKRQGKDVTVVATSLMVQRALQAAGKLAQKGIDVEVVDPRTLVPLDKSAIIDSVAKTGRLVVADECHKSCGVASEIAAIVAEEGFHHLKAPIRRVATPDVPIPFSRPMEAYIEPSEEKIVQAVLGVVG